MYQFGIKNPQIIRKKHHPKNIAEETWNFIQKHALKGAKIDAEVHEISTFPRKGVSEKPTIIAGVCAQNQGWIPSKSTGSRFGELPKTFPKMHRKSDAKSIDKSFRNY